DERKSFMSACLAGKEPEKMTQQEKMKVCNQKAADMKGDERKKFMSACLKG
ncbi:MAG: phosphate starvation-inducible protein PsiF, partial [Burkholderiales bacterium]|nr:phosphate starvation-inducible protein PsiF [Burkholderiales bacterium]